MNFSNVLEVDHFAVLVIVDEFVHAHLQVLVGRVCCLQLQNLVFKIFARLQQLRQIYLRVVFDFENLLLRLTGAFELALRGRIRKQKLLAFVIY